MKGGGLEYIQGIWTADPTNDQDCCAPLVGVGGGLVIGGGGWTDWGFGGVGVGGLAVEAAGVKEVALGGLALGGLVNEREGPERVLGGLATGGQTAAEKPGGLDSVYGGVATGGEVIDMAVQTITVSQEITGGGSGNTVNIGHATSGVVAATYGTAAKVPQLAVNADGHLTSVLEVPINIPAADVSGLAAVATSGHASDLTGLAAVALSGHASDLIGLAAVALSGNIADLTGTISNTLLVTRSVGQYNFVGTITSAGHLTWSGDSAVVFTFGAATGFAPVALLTMPAGSFILNAYAYWPTKFAGTGITALTMTVNDGVPPLATIMAPNSLAASAVVQNSAIADNSFTNSFAPYRSGGQSLAVGFTSTGANLNQLTAGVVHLSVTFIVVP